MRTVIGIDANSHKLALVWKRRSGKPFFQVFELSRGEDAAGEAFQVLNEFFYNALQDGLMDEGQVHVFMEAPIMGVGGPGATIPQAYVEGAVKAACYEWGIPCKLVNNQSWKKRVLDSGNINKAEVTKRMKDKWPELYQMCPMVREKKDVLVKDQDVIDAAAIHLFGEASVKLLSKALRHVKRNRPLAATA